MTQKKTEHIIIIIYITFKNYSKYELLRCYSVSDVDFMSSISTTFSYSTLRFGQV